MWDDLVDKIEEEVERKIAKLLTTSRVVQKLKSDLARCMEDLSRANTYNYHLRITNSELNNEINALRSLGYKRIQEMSPEERKDERVKENAALIKYNSY